MTFPVCTADATNTATPAEDDSIFCIQAEIRAIKEYLQTYVSADIPVGSYVNYLGATPPPGWVFANQEISRTAYADLFALLAEFYGAGDGSTTFDLPNLYDTSGEASVITYTDAPYAAAYATINELPDGRLVFIGGFDGTNYKTNVYFGTITGTGATKTITWAAGTALPAARAYHATFIASDGTIFIIGGATTGGAQSSLIYRGTVSGNIVSWATSAASYTLGINPTYVQGLGSKSYAFFWNSSSTVYDIDPLTGVMRVMSGTLDVPRAYAGVCALDASTFLVAGGRKVADSTYMSECYIATLTSGGTTLNYVAATALPIACAFLNARVLPDGRVLLIGLQTGGATMACYIGTISGTTIAWEDATTVLASFISELPVALALTTLATGDILRAGGNTTESGYIAEVLSYRPSRVIIKT